ACSQTRSWYASAYVASATRSQLSLHAALPLSRLPAAPLPSRDVARRDLRGTSTGVPFPLVPSRAVGFGGASQRWRAATGLRTRPDRKSTRLNSSHVKISYDVLCLKKKTAPDAQ